MLLYLMRCFGVAVVVEVVQFSLQLRRSMKVLSGAWRRSRTIEEYFKVASKLRIEKNITGQAPI